MVGNHRSCLFCKKISEYFNIVRLNNHYNPSNENDLGKILKDITNLEKYCYDVIYRTGYPPAESFQEIFSDGWIRMTEVIQIFKMLFQCKKIGHYYLYRLAIFPMIRMISPHRVNFQKLLLSEHFQDKNQIQPVLNALEIADRFKHDRVHPSDKDGHYALKVLYDLVVKSAFRQSGREMCWFYHGTWLRKYWIELLQRFPNTDLIQEAANFLPSKVFIKVFAPVLYDMIAEDHLPSSPIKSINKLDDMKEYSSTSSNNETQLFQQIIDTISTFSSIPENEISECADVLIMEILKYSEVFLVKSLIYLEHPSLITIVKSHPKNKINAIFKVFLQRIASIGIEFVLDQLNISDVKYCMHELRKDL